MELSKSTGFKEGTSYKLQEKEFLPHEDVKPGEGLKLKLNLDIITLDFIDNFEAKLDEAAHKLHQNHKQSKNFLDALESEFANLNEAENFDEVKERIKTKYEQSVASDTAESKILFELMRTNIREKAMMLGGLPGSDDPSKRIIHSWNMIKENGDEVPVSYEALVKFSERFIEKLFRFCKTDAAEPTKDEKKR